MDKCVAKSFEMGTFAENLNKTILICHLTNFTKKNLLFKLKEEGQRLN